METQIDTSKRRFLKYAPLLPWGVTAGIIGYQAKEIGISTLEISENMQKATALNANTYLQDQHNSLLQHYQESNTPLHPEYGPWHSVQIMGLLKAAEYASNEVFVTPEDSFKTMNTIEVIFDSVYDSPPDTAQNIYTDWMYGSLSSTGYHVGSTLAYQAAITGISKTPNETTDELFDPLARRAFLTMAAAGSATIALGFGMQAMELQPLSKSMPKVQFGIYNDFPIDVLNRITDIDTFNSLNNLISPNFLSSNVSIYHLDEESYAKGLVDQFKYYEDRLTSSLTTKEDQENIKTRIQHLQNCSFDAYNIRLAYVENALEYFSKSIQTVAPSDRILSLQFNDDVSPDGTILNSGIGLSVYHTTLMHQSIPHGTNVIYTPSP